MYATYILLALTDHQLEMDIIATVTLLVFDWYIMCYKGATPLVKPHSSAMNVGHQMNVGLSSIMTLISPLALYLQCANLK